MTVLTAPAMEPTSEHGSRLRWEIADALTITWRNLKGMSRTPEVIVFSTVQPVIFVLTFRYVFGGAIQTPGDIPYVDFLMPGVFAQTVAFGGMNTGIGLSEDLHQGLIERFRSLPMARSAVLAGRSLADLVRNLGVVALVALLGFLVGYDYHAGFAAFIGSLALLLLFSFALSWVFANIGLRAPNSEAAQAASFPILAILVFASTAFAPEQFMPGWLQAYNDVQPVSVVVKAVRVLSTGGETAVPVLHAVLWCVALVAVFAPLAVRKYRRSA
jgi:ABC-2 type transport system permease protein/oleandomycin transport system permease protein